LHNTLTSACPHITTLHRGVVRNCGVESATLLPTIRPPFLKAATTTNSAQHTNVAHPSALHGL
jgi:hypothetical protein